MIPAPTTATDQGHGSVSMTTTAVSRRASVLLVHYAVYGT